MNAYTPDQADRIDRCYRRARYWSQCGLPWHLAAERARDELAADPPPPDLQDRFRRRFPPPSNDLEWAQARRMAAAASTAMSKAAWPPHQAA